MISGINAFAVENRNLMTSVPSSAPRNEQSPGEPNRALTASPWAADEISLSEPGSLSVGDGFQQRTALSIRSRLRVDQTDDGQLRATLRSQLRFQYEFEGADGTKIRIRAKANLHYSQTSDGDQQSQSLRLRVKASVTVVQQNVTSGVAALREAPEIFAGAQDAISQALELFQKVTDAATSLFLEGDPLDGDQLIADLVDAFNEFTGTIDTMTEPSATNLLEAIPSEIVEQIENPAVEPSEAPLARPTVSKTATPVAGVTAAPPAELLPQEIVPIPDGESAVVAGRELAEVSVPENAEELESVAEDETDAAESTKPTASQQSFTSAASVKLRMRFQFIQSLTSIVGAFESDSSSLLVSQSAFRASVQMAARYSLPALGESDSLSQGQEIDAQV